MEQVQENFQKETLSSSNKSSFTLGLIFVFLIAASLWYANYALHFNGFVINDSHDYAQLAKNVYEGNGYSTSVLRPLVYQFFNTLPQPEVTRMFGYPYLLGFFYKIAGPNDFSIVLLNGIFYVALILLVYVFSYELSKNIFVSLISALMVACMKGFLDHSLQAEPNIMYSALFIAFFYLYIKHPQRTFLHGVSLGFLYLIRANTQFVFIAFFLVVVFSDTKKIKEKIRIGAELSLGFLIGILPYLIRNYAVIGNPLFSLYSYSFLLFTRDFPAYTVWTQISDVNPLLFAATHLSEMLFKSYNWLQILLKDSVIFYNPLVLLLLGIAFLVPVGNYRLRRLKSIVLAGIVVQTIMVLPFGAVPYYYMFFFPLIIIVSVINFAEFFKSYGRIILIFSFIIFMVANISYWKSHKPLNPFISLGKQVELLTNKNDIILTDMPWELAWYADRRAIWLPFDLDTLEIISKTLRPTYAVLSGRTYAPYKDAVWNRILKEPSYAEELGYEFKGIIYFQNTPVAAMFKILDR